MKRKMCMCCFNQAAYVSNNSNLALCEDCYISMSDDFESSCESSTSMCFDDFYDIEEFDQD